MAYGKDEDWYYAQMESNSNKWYQASTEEEKNRLHEENVRLAAERDSIFGGKTVFRNDGTWASQDGTKSSKVGDAVVFEKDKTYNTYTSPYANKISDAIKSLKNKKFTYDLESDPVWQSYKQQFLREADRSAADTLGNVAGMTGGMPSSYAASAATQAANYQKSQLTDKIPELYELAYNKYQGDYNQDYNYLQLLNEADNTGYGRWADAWDRNNEEAKADYDKLNYYNEWNYKQEQDEISNKLKEREIGVMESAEARAAAKAAKEDQDTAYDHAMEIASSSGKMPSEELIAKSGISAQDYQNIADAYNKAQTDADTKKAYDICMDQIKIGVRPSDEDLAKAGINTSTADALVARLRGN